MKKHIVISGKVQGVGFRYWFYKAAIQKNIDGWVRNKISGEVEALLVGNEVEINELIKFLLISIYTFSILINVGFFKTNLFLDKLYSKSL